MQTFLPYPDVKKSVQALDNKRLGKQRVETKQIYFACIDSTYGWQNHPAVKMWRGYEDALAYYGMHCCYEYRNRGYNDSLLPWFLDLITIGVNFDMPFWFGNERFHLSHQSNLKRKDPVYYKHFNVPPNLAYIWPVI